MDWLSTGRERKDESDSLPRRSATRNFALIGAADMTTAKVSGTNTRR